MTLIPNFTQKSKVPKHFRSNPFYCYSCSPNSRCSEVMFNNCELHFTFYVNCVFLISKVGQAGHSNFTFIFMQNSLKTLWGQNVCHPFTIFHKTGGFAFLLGHSSFGTQAGAGSSRCWCYCY